MEAFQGNDRPRLNGEWVTIQHLYQIPNLVQLWIVWICAAPLDGTDSSSPIGATHWGIQEFPLPQAEPELAQCCLGYGAG